MAAEEGEEESLDTVRTRDEIPHIKKENYGKEADLREQHERRKQKVGTKTKPS